MTWLSDIHDAMADAHENRRRQLRTLVNTYEQQPQVADRLAEWADTAGLLPDNILISFAKADIRPESQLGQWAIHNASLVLDRRREVRRYANEANGPAMQRIYGKQLSEVDEQLAFLADTTRVGQLGELDEQGQERVLSSNFEDVAQFDRDQLGRLAEGRDPTPEPGGIGGVFHDIGDVATTGIRTTGAVLSSGYETAQMGLRIRAANPDVYDPGGGAFREFTGGAPLGTTYFNTERDLPGGGKLRIGSGEEVYNPEQITLVNMIRGDDAGSGFFPSGEARTRQAEASRAAAAIVDDEGNASALTLGRGFAATVVEPGTKPFNVISGTVDFANAVWGDPADLALLNIADIRKARRLFTPEGAGAFAGTTRHFAHGPTFTQWADSKVGQRAAQEMANTSSFTELRALTKKKLGVELTARIAETSDPLEVRALLDDAVTFGRVREVPEIAARAPRWMQQELNYGYSWTRPFANVRWAHQMPRGTIDINDLDNAVEQLERTLIAAKVPRSEWDPILTLAAQAQSRTDLLVVAKDFLGEAVERQLRTEFNVPKDSAKRLTRFFNDDHEEARQYFLDEVGNTPHMPGVTINGQTVELAGPHLPSELLNRGIPMLDGRELRRSASHWGQIWDTPYLGAGIKGTTYALDYFTDAIFKVGALARGAWPVRVVGEEQARMAAAGLDSMYRNPVSYIGWVAGTNVSDRRIATRMQKLMGKTDNALGRGATDILDQEWVDILADSQAQYTRGLSRKRGKFADQPGAALEPDRLLTKHWVQYDRASTEFVGMWADELSHLHLDPLTREAARAMLDPTWTPAGIGRASPGSRLIGNEITDAATIAREESNLLGIDALKEWFKTGAGQSYRKELIAAGGWRANLADDLWADKYIESVVKRVRDTTGADERLLTAIGDGNAWRTGRTSRELRGTLDELAEQGVGPLKVKGPLVVDGKTKSMYARVTDRMFGALMSTPTNKLSRSPAFRQFYWQERVPELMPRLTPEAQAQLLRVAKTNNLPRETMQRLRDGMRTSGPVTLEQADVLAKAHALERTRDLLYDAAERGNFFDATRIVFPFGEAWKEVLTRWTTLVKENPRVGRRLQQVIEGARNAGFFYTDPQDGQEYFSFNIGHLSQAFTGLPFDMRGRVSGLNVVGQGLPGVGPVIQIPAAQLIPKEQKWDWLRDFVSPYGDPDLDGGFLEAWFPGWAQKLRAGGWFDPIVGPTADQERVFENAVKDAATYRFSTGAYPQTPEGMAALIADAKSDAKKLYMFRSAVQFIAPTAPQVRPVVTGKDGKAYELRVVVEDYQRMVDAHNGDWSAATIEFLDRYGSTAYLAIEPRSRRTGFGVPTTKEAELWRNEHSEFAAAYPNVYGFFAPTGGEFDYNAYERALARGDIKADDPEDWLARANDRVASAIYADKQRVVGPNPQPEQREWLAAWRTRLMGEFPGYDPMSPPGNRASRDKMIFDLQAAVEQPDVADTDLAKAVSKYLTQRDKALASAKEAGLSTLGGKSVADLRGWLRTWGDRLVRETPEFAAVWDYVFSSEVQLTEDELAEAAA